MSGEPAITLDCFLKDGSRAKAELTHHTLPEAREVAKWVLQAGNGMYTEVKVCIEGVPTETIQNSELNSKADLPNS